MLPEYNEELIKSLGVDKDNDSIYLIKLIQIKLTSMKKYFNDNILVSNQIDEVLELGYRLIEDEYNKDLEEFFNEYNSTILEDEDKLNTYINLSNKVNELRSTDYKKYFNLLGEYSDYWWDSDDKNCNML